MAAPLFRDGTSATGAGTANTLAIPKPIMQLDDILVFFNYNASRDNPITVYPTTGWEAQPYQNGPGTVGIGGQAAVKRVTQAEIDATSLTFTWGTASVKAGMLVSFSGGNGNLPVNVYEGFSVAASRSYHAPSVAPTKAETLILAMWGGRFDSGSVSSTATTVVEQIGRTNASIGMGTVAGPASGTESGTKLGTWAGTVDEPGIALTIALAPISLDTTPPAAPTGLTAVFL